MNKKNREFEGQFLADFYRFRLKKYKTGRKTELTFRLCKPAEYTMQHSSSGPKNNIQIEFQYDAISAMEIPILFFYLTDICKMLLIESW